MTHDAAHWDERYAAAPAPGPAHVPGAAQDHRPAPVTGSDHLAGAPDPAVMEALDDLPPGRALDVATGLGRHARWLAARGWAVTAVDFSTVGIARARELEAEVKVKVKVEVETETETETETEPDHPAGTPISWVVADVRSWVPEPAAYELILCAFVHLDPETFARIRTWLAPRGRLVVVTHAPGSADGPRNPAYRYDEPQLRAAAKGLDIERLDIEGLDIERLDDHDGRLALVARRR